MKTIALYSIKGGVGKTAAAVNLAHAAAAEGRPVLLCDLDPQGSASYYLRVRSRKRHKSNTLLAGRKALARNIRGTDYQGLDALPATLSYRKLDLVLDGLERPEKGLRWALKPLRREFDLLFLDCAPGLNLVAESVFRCSDLLLVPVIPTTLSIRTLELLDRFFAKKKLPADRIRPFFSMVENRKKLHRDVVAQWRGTDRRFLASRVPYSADIEKMGIHREPVACFKPRSAGAGAFAELWNEVREVLEV